MNKLVILIVAINLASCSMSGNNKNNSVTKGDDLEFAVDTFVDSSQNEEFYVQEEAIAANEPVYNDFQNDFQQDFSAVEAPERIVINNAREEVSGYDFMDNYVVQKGDTLMLVAYKIYGDYGKWKDLKDWNPQEHQIKEGTILKYKVPERAFGWSPEGSPYLIKRGDTLGSISMDVYQTSRKWQEIYEHNKPLIKHPNLIFAGFTIFYKKNRQLASGKE